MTVLSSDSPRCRARSIVGKERGAVLAVTVLSLIVLLACAGLAIDLGRGYITKIRLTRAVDAGALAGARALRARTESDARDEVQAVARANGVTVERDDISFANDDTTLERTVTVAAAQMLPTTFMRVVGIMQMNVNASAVAAVPPMDILLPLDVSLSLRVAGAWGHLQQAARDFVEHFDDNTDQMGLVAFQAVAADQESLRRFFRIPIQQKINGMASDGWTNVGEGLRLAYQQITGPSAREDVGRAVVFFTDGRPTAVRGLYGFEGDEQDRIMAVVPQGTRISGYLDDPDDLHLPPFNFKTWDGCQGVGECFGRYDEEEIRADALEAGLHWANEIRQEEVLVYSIGLGNFQSPNVDSPDLGYLCQIANSSGIANAGNEDWGDDCDGITPDGDQPIGKVYFAPTPSELREVFREVALDLQVRLAQ